MYSSPIPPRDRDEIHLSGSCMLRADEPSLMPEALTRLNDIEMMDVVKHSSIDDYEDKVYDSLMQIRRKTLTARSPKISHQKGRP